MPEINYAEDFSNTEDILSRLSPPVRNWFKDKFDDFTDPQKVAIPRILDGDHLLLCSPTGSGKTLTAFLTIIDELVRKSLDGTLDDTIQCVYISPIKALANDIQKNLIGPLTEIKERFLPGRAQEIKVGLRTGDTPQKERERMLRKPPHILITTPESLGLALASKRFRPILNDMKWLIVDELHSLVPTKRGTHLSLSLALMDSVVESNVQRIGISATMEPLDDVAEFLVASDTRGGGKETQQISIAKISGSRELDLDILLSTPRFTSIPVKEILEHNIELIKELVEAHTTTLVFVNTRNMTETFVQRLKVAGLAGVEGHHGSMDKTIRLDVEQKLKNGQLRCVVSSSSLEMGIDIGSVDLVVQVGSPGSIATALQRIGRAGHQVDGLPRARFLPTSPHDLLEVVALQNGILSGNMDLLKFPENCLDVLAQFLIGLTIIREWDIDEAYDLVSAAWPYRNLPWDDYIEVVDLLEEERRIWVDWEENRFGKRGYAQMIYYTNIGTIAPDNNYLVFTSDGTLVGQLSSSFVSSLRNGDVFLLGGSTYRVSSVIGTRVNVTSATGYRPTIPSWTGEAMSRTSELSDEVLGLLGILAIQYRTGQGIISFLTDVLGLNKPVANALTQFLDEHSATTFQVPSKNRILVEQVAAPLPTYVVTTCRGRAFNLALGYLFAGMASKDNIAIHELSFDENGFMAKLSHEIEVSAIPAVFRSSGSEDSLHKYLIESQLFAKRFREVASRSMLNPRRIGAEEVSPKQFQQKAEQIMNRHRKMEDSVIVREAMNEILTTDLDMIQLRDFTSRMQSEDVRIVHRRVKIPSPLGLTLFMSSFEDLLSLRTRAYLIKDVDPEILRRLLGARSLATELDEAKLSEYYQSKVSVPNNATELLRLMDMGGGLERQLTHPLYSEKLKDIEFETLRGWVHELAERGLITKVDGTGHEKIDGKWFSMRMTEVHGTLGCLAMAGAADMEDLRELYTGGLSYQIGESFQGGEPSEWKTRGLSDPLDCLRLKLLDMLGSEGPQTAEALSSRLPFPSAQVDSVLQELEMRNLVSIGFFTQTDEGEFILRVDEYRITGGQVNVIDYRTLQTLILNKSFRTFEEPSDAIRNLALVQRREELLHRVKNFRFRDWKDIKHDSDIYNGRLLHNRVGYTLGEQLPMLMGLRSEPWFGPLDEELMAKIPDGGISRSDLLADYPKGKENVHIQRSIKSALSNLERQLAVAKQYLDVPNRKRSMAIFRRLHGKVKPLPFDEALSQLISSIGPVRLHTLRFFVARPVEELADTLRDLEEAGEIARVVTLQPDPTDYYASPVDAEALLSPLEEDREMRILSQSDPFSSRFIQEVRLLLKRGWYYPVFKGVDPIGRVLMFVVNDYLEIKDINIPHSYLDDFKVTFGELLENYRDRLVDVSVLHAFNGVPVHDCDENIQKILSELGFSSMGDGERYIRGGVVEPRSRKQVTRMLFFHHFLHQNSRWENETMALERTVELRDDFALRGRCEMFRVNLSSMVAAHQLHQGSNLRGHLVWARYPHFQRLLSIRNVPIEPEDEEIIQFFRDTNDPELYMERNALKRSEFRKLISPLVRSGHLIQDYRGGFKTVEPLPKVDLWEIKRDYLREMVQDYPVITLRQLERLAGSSFSPEDISDVMHEFEEDGTLIKGFLVDDLQDICWGRLDMLEGLDGLKLSRDLVIPPSDPLIHYFGSLLRERFGFGSAYLVFHKEEPIAAFKANTRNNTIEITDFVGDSDLEREAIRVMKEFAWEHDMPLTGKLYNRIRSRMI
ncbi:MAG TPA: DEAD/DEAH box helicase [Candidatus Thalassarchaeaceae archaeon]|nr:DEAD/DEAH box helicase [Candidatus Thalassarchaeaceae archaeon]|tara:strand:+ start:16510 stop:21807 length:5298 start_codon:yes stop_codon:yes gene_type:complete